MFKTEPFDAARYLVSPQSQAELLDNALASGDAPYIGQALGVIARARGASEATVTSILPPSPSPPRSRR
ncbi:MAG: hypothetical protein H0X27_06755 [Caulobacteraceae bacterium]|nr:hypothetical protein [Caulobacteraceae bacterium]